MLLMRFCGARVLIHGLSLTFFKNEKFAAQALSANSARRRRPPLHAVQHGCTADDTCADAFPWASGARVPRAPQNRQASCELTGPGAPIDASRTLAGCRTRAAGSVDRRCRLRNRESPHAARSH